MVTLAPPVLIALHITTLFINNLPIMRSRGVGSSLAFLGWACGYRKFSFLDGVAAPLLAVLFLEFDTIMNEGKRGGTFGVASASSFCKAPGFLARQQSSRSATGRWTCERVCVSAFGCGCGCGCVFRGVLTRCSCLITIIEEVSSNAMTMIVICLSIMFSVEFCETPIPGRKLMMMQR